jgi:hypothetical protein
MESEKQSLLRALSTTLSALADGVNDMEGSDE